MSLDIRVYNVGFGDASLLSWKEDSGEERNIMIDFGNAPAIKDEPYYTQTVKSIKKITKNKIDLLICTHQHLDHYGGFYSKIKEFRKFKIRKILMPYIEPVSKEKIRNVRELVHSLVHSKLASDTIFKKRLVTRDELVRESPIEGDNKWDSIANLVKKEDTHFLHRKSKGLSKIIRELGFKKMKFDVLAPEQDTGIYLSAAQKWIKNLLSFYQASTGVYPKNLFVADQRSIDELSLPLKRIGNLKPEFLKEFITKNGDISEYAERIVNNTSLVIRFDYKSKNKKTSLLFPGDAQFESWQKIVEASKRKEHSINAQFLKVSHHGSHNGTSNNIAMSIFEEPKKYNTAIISTLSGVYGTENEVPSQKVFQILRKYATVCSTETRKPGEPILITY